MLKSSDHVVVCVCVCVCEREREREREIERERERKAVLSNIICSKRGRCQYMYI